MIMQGFPIGNNDWFCEVFYAVHQENLWEAYKKLIQTGCPDYMAQQACMVLSQKNKAYTFSNFKTRHTVILLSEATSPEQMYDSIQHETKHAVEHISEYYGLNPKGETSAYLQGEIARLMFPAVALAVCPKCNEQKRR